MSVTNIQLANLSIAQLYAPVRAKLPEEFQPIFDKVVSSVIIPEKIALFFEIGYAQAAALDDTLKNAVADVGNFAWQNGWYMLGANNRGMLMEKVLRGDPLPSGATAPVPMPEYTVAPVQLVEAVTSSAPVMPAAPPAPSASASPAVSAPAA